ncbi:MULTISPECIES: glycosyltransferase family 17 protein [Acetobacter]|uniref:N-acetylglucosaminyltransferase n=1 Tax=Acetobacter tropicalis TaxID=104102 RepID=A0A291PHW5_9PROT|nr:MULTISPECIES: hypothetical protein [Acetobacter]ATJ90964.1 hypothetical protein CIW82_09965 [Acetobacter tropicalis]MCC6105609.1 hypothetical protein [Acetobacter sp.]MCG4255846.1 hypothetical protein [Acetobacter senegalensis]MCG4265753.1 hypothetical protein [Acetobacter senegalensis]MCG4272648.1 hypothetical protein [Acetobacter senegalensis]
MPKIYDCFPFFNELEMLEIRLKLMDPVVDYFVICESNRTFTNNEKPRYFFENKERFLPWREKIIYVQIDDFPDTQDPFQREYYQRNALLRVAAQADDDDMFIIADVDELVRPQCILEASNFDGFVTFHMPMFQFYMNLKQSDNGWSACYATRKKYLVGFENLSTARWDRTKIAADLAPKGKMLDLHNSGWHFTHLGGIERLKYKFNSYSHAHDLWPSAMRKGDALKNHIISGGVVGNFKETCRFVPISYPEYPLIINDNQTYYKELGFIKDIYEAMAELQVLYKNVCQQYARLVKNENTPQEVLSWVTPQEYAHLSDITL